MFNLIFCLLCKQKLFRGRLYSNIEEENEENKLAVNEGSFLPDTIGDKPLRALPNKSESLPTDMSDNSESETQERVDTLLMMSLGL